MKFNELLKKIRLEKGYSYKDIADKTGFSKGFINNIEKGERGSSEKFLRALINLFPTYEEILVKSYAEQKISSIANNNLKIEGFEPEKDTRKFKFKVYKFISDGNGEAELNSFEEMVYVLDKKTGEEILKNGFVFQIVGDAVAPILFDGDRIIFLKEEFTKWENLDSKLILVKLDDVYYVRKLYFEDGEPYLHSFNDRLYPKIRISDIKKVEYIGQLDSQLYRDMRKVTF